MAAARTPAVAAEREVCVNRNPGFLSGDRRRMGPIHSFQSASHSFSFDGMDAGAPENL